MALPSRPNARLGGLPSGPRSRSFTAGGSAREEPHRSASTTRDYARSRAESSPPEAPVLRHQRSFSGASSSRGRAWEEEAPPMPPLPSAQRTKVADKLSKLKGGRSDSVSSLSNASSSSSSRAGSGYTSPATSFDEYDQEDKYEEGEEDSPAEAKPVPPGFGSSLWGRLALAAGSLSINVSKAWDSNASVSSGEGEYLYYVWNLTPPRAEMLTVSSPITVTPPGQESRITRAMKAYHIAQASKPSDLPEWLFDEKERGLTARVPAKDGNEDDGDRPRAAPLVESSRPNAPSTPYSSKAGASTGPNRPGARRDYDDDFDRAKTSKATQRLRELRDAKANTRGKASESAARRAEEEAAAQNEPPQRMSAATTNATGQRPMPPGLPSGVRPRRT